MRLIDLLDLVHEGNSFEIALGIEQFDYWDLHDWYKNGEDNNQIPSCVKNNWNELKNYEVDNLAFRMFNYKELMIIDLNKNKVCKTEITLLDLLDKVCTYNNSLYFYINDFCDKPFEEIHYNNKLKELDLYSHYNGFTNDEIDIAFLVEKQKIEWNKIKNKPIKNFYVDSIDIDDDEDETKVLLRINLKE